MLSDREQFGALVDSVLVIVFKPPEFKGYFENKISNERPLTVSGVPLLLRIIQGAFLSLE
ncbi:hypothetical protein IRB23SM22_17150 [Alkalibacterium sp. s-m-22]